ncbi:MAG TPA: DUF3515 domain-containing protein [Nocardioides sp.]|nr:DUF3515 domain-containing protein [Nocardioides sp.]
MRRTLCAAGALGLAISLSGCGSSPVAVPHPSGADATACASFMAALPERLADQSLASKASDGPQATYGDPAIVVSCGVGVPDGFGVGAECQVANGVGWYLPSAQYDDQSLDATITAAGYQPRVEVDVPARYRPAAVAAVMSQLAGAVRRYFRKTTGCV